MDSLTTLLLLAMTLTLIENTFVAVVAVVIYVRQRRANEEMEKRINRAIEDVKKFMQSDKILGALTKNLKRMLNGWISGKKSGASRSIDKLGGAIGGVATLQKLRNAEGWEEKALVLAEYGAEQLEKQKQEEAAKAQQEAAVIPAPATVDDYKSVNMSPDEYKRLYDEGLKTMEGKTNEV